MSITLQFVFEIDDVATDVTSIVLSDPTGTYGVKRDDDDAVVAADGTAMTKIDTGTYTYTFDPPADGLEYTWYAEYVYAGDTYYSPGTYSDTTKVVTLAEAKTHLRVTGTDDDVAINSFIDMATSWAERYTRRRFLTATCIDYRDSWPAVWRPRWSPLLAVTSIQYVDSNGDTQTLASSVYDVDTDSEPGRIVEAYNQSWPTIRSQINAITLTYTAGYGTSATDVPAPIRAALLMLVGHFYENREAAAEVALSTVPYGVKQLLGMYRLVAA